MLVWLYGTGLHDVCSVYDDVHWVFANQKMRVHLKTVIYVIFLCSIMVFVVEFDIFANYFTIKFKSTLQVQTAFCSGCNNSDLTPRITPPFNRTFAGRLLENKETSKNNKVNNNIVKKVVDADKLLNQLHERNNTPLHLRNNQNNDTFKDRRESIRRKSQQQERDSILARKLSKAKAYRQFLLDTNATFRVGLIRLFFLHRINCRG